MLNKKNKGFTLLELLISIFILSVGILGSYVAIQKSAAIASYSYNRLMAAYLAQEGIEIIRNIKDTNLLEGLTDPLVLWDEGIVRGNYEMQYSDVQGTAPIFSQCSGYCDKFTVMLPLVRDGLFYNYDSGTDTKFRRKVAIELGIDVLNVSATVYWQEGSKIKEFTVWDKFYNWF
jgi:prepilin-type N-terminal cleavage/methylation domain-containing protein